MLHNVEVYIHWLVGSDLGKDRPTVVVKVVRLLLIWLINGSLSLCYDCKASAQTRESPDFCTQNFALGRLSLLVQTDLLEYETFRITTG